MAGAVTPNLHENGRRRPDMKWRAILLAISLVAGLVSMTACTVKQTEEGKMPDVDVNVEDGNLPKYDVDAPDVDVNIEREEVKVPDVDVDVDMEKKEIPLPDVDVHPADDKENDDPNS
jgi:hypothetical protein